MGHRRLHVAAGGARGDRRIARRRFGRRRLFLIGLGVFTIASGVCAAAPNIAVLNVARAVQGTGAAVMFAVSLAVLSVAFPRPEQRMLALAAYGATMAGSFAVGPLVGGALTTVWGWPSIFLINVPLGVLGILLVRKWVSESTDPDARRVDWPGLVTLSGGLFFVVFALLHGNDDGWSSSIVVGAFVAAATLLIAFVVVELRTAQPMLPLGSFRSPLFAGAQVAAVGLSASLFALWFFLTLYLQQVLGLSAVSAGLVFLPGTVVNLLVAGAMSKVARRVSPARIITAGSALVAGGLLLLIVVGTDTSWWWFLPGLLVAMVGTGALNPTVSAVALDSLLAAQSGLAAGVNDMFRQAAIAIGIAAYGAIAPIALAFQPATHGTYVEDLYDALWVGAGVALVCGLVAGRLVARRSSDAARAEPAHVGERQPVDFQAALDRLAVLHDDRHVGSVR